MSRTLLRLWLLFCLVTIVIIETHSATPARVDLQRWYAGYNEEYFLNQLPKDAKVQFGEGEGDNDINMGMTFRGEGGIRIIVSKNWNPSDKQALLTLLHEMCHVSIEPPPLDAHSARWQECMVRLADKGAFNDLW